MSLVAPSPLRASSRVSYSLTFSSAGFELMLVYRAGKAVRHQDNGVAGRGVGVDAHAVQRSIDDVPGSADRSSAGSTVASVSTTAIIVAMSGSIMPTPLAIPTTLAGPVPILASADLGDGVGRHDPPAAAPARPGRPPAGSASP